MLTQLCHHLHFSDKSTKHLTSRHVDKIIKWFDLSRNYADWLVLLSYVDLSYIKVASRWQLKPLTRLILQKLSSSTDNSFFRLVFSFDIDLINWQVNIIYEKYVMLPCCDLFRNLFNLSDLYVDLLDIG